MRKKKNLAFTWWWTWGHIFPLLSLYNYFKEDNIYNFFWAWERDSLEEKIALENDIKFLETPAWKIRRYFDFRNFYEPLKNITGFFYAIYYILRYRIKIIFSKWWYVSIPFCLAWFILRRKIYIHESDAVIWLANKFIWKLATKVFYTFPIKNINFWKKHILTWQILNPDLLTNLRNINAFENKNLEILIIAGAQGSTRIFEVMLNIIPSFPEINFTVTLWTKNLSFRKKFEKFENVKIYDFLSPKDLGSIYKTTDIAITRWSSALREQVAFGIHSIIIPLTESAWGHQQANASYFKKTYSSDVLDENRDLEANLYNKIKRYKDLRKIRLNLDDFFKSLKIIEKEFLLILALFLVIFSQINITNSTDKELPYTVWVWWGWAMYSFSINPYSDLWFVWTDMGQLYKSTDLWSSWKTIDQRDFKYSAKKYLYNYFWFSPDSETIYWAIIWCDPRISYDSWKTWSSMENLKNLMPTWGYKFADCRKESNKNRIKYFLTDSFDENFVISAMWDWIIISKDKWVTWTRIKWVTWESKGSFIDYTTSPHTIYHASENAIYISTDWWDSFSVFVEDENIKSFAGWRDNDWLTLTYIKQKNDSPNSLLKIKKDELDWETKYENLLQHVRMAENNSKIIYITWDREKKKTETWEKNMIGTNIWKSTDAWENWELIFNIYGKAYPSLEASWVWLDIWYWDWGFRSFAINRRNPNILWWTGNFFLHTTKDWWKTWQSPFTKFEGLWEIWAWKTWSSRWIEPTSARKIKFHPKNPNLWYAPYADIKWKVTEDGWKTWKLIGGKKPDWWKHWFNTFYDFAFDENNENIVYWVTSKWHDYYSWYWQSDPMVNTPDNKVWAWFLLKSEDKWKTWTRLTPDNYEYDMPFLSVAYDSKHNIIYAWSQWRWVAKSTDNWETWEWITSWMADESLYPRSIIQMELDPENWDLYALLAWDRLFWPHYEQVNWDLEELLKISNYWLTWIYRLKYGEENWEFLRENLFMENPVNWWPTWKSEFLLHPYWFAIDWNDESRNTMFMADSTWRNYKVSWIWKTTDWWKNWYMKKTTSHAKSVTINPNNSNEIHAASMSRTDEAWSLYSKDGWETWEVNNDLPITNKFLNVTIDPNDPTKVFYSTFWAWIRYANNPFYFSDDTTAPIITLNWESEITIELLDDFTDPWATCTDNTDENCDVIVWWDSVNTNEAWTYNITYNATDKAWNNATEVIRKVIVKKKINAQFVDIVPPVITLKWEPEITIKQWSSNIATPKANCTDDKDKTCKVIISWNIVVKNKYWSYLKTDKPGVYTIKYNATDKAWNEALEVTRKIIIEEVEEPVIKLIWKSNVRLKLRNPRKYKIPWAKCYDNKDETCEVIVWWDTVDVNKVWTYIITYNATDSDWNKAKQKLRMVTIRP